LKLTLDGLAFSANKASSVCFGRAQNQRYNCAGPARLEKLGRPLLALSRYWCRRWAGPLL